MTWNWVGPAASLVIDPGLVIEDPSPEQASAGFAPHLLSPSLAPCASLPGRFKEGSLGEGKEAAAHPRSK